MNKETFKIRNATINDISDICVLSKGLGYPTSELDLRERLNSILKYNDHAVYVAYLPDGKVIAWIHVFEALRIESKEFAEIGGFVVTEKYRNIGVGKKLLKVSEEWALKRKLPKLRVRSRIEREDAKKFYLKMGFSISKKQSVFDKIMKKTLSDD
jgi:GNAT superfamily N-acetyltransferase